MDEPPAPKPEEPCTRSADSSIGVWLVAGVVMTTALALVAVHCPPRIRLIGLFSVSFGLIVGWLLARITEKLNCLFSNRTVGISAIVFTLGGLIGSTWEASRLNESQKSKSGNDAVAARLIEQFKMQSSTDDRERGAGIPNPDPPSQLIVFKRYLSWRLQPLGEWTSPWPEAFWCLELCASAAASVWISRSKR